MEDTKIQWHPGFCSAMHLELMQDKENLEFHKEFPLNTKPLLIDLLVIQKKQDIVLKNEIWKLFRGHNIMEYKSPEDELGIDVYFKVYAYACLYKAGGEHENSIGAEDVTITLVRERKPVVLMKYLKNQGYILEKRYPGIYYIQKDGFFDTQIVVTKELGEESHVWLRSLTASIDKTSAGRLISRIQELTDKEEKENADSVLKVTMDANDNWFELIKKEDAGMNDSLRKLMKPELEEAERIGETRGEERGKAIGEARGKMIGERQGVSKGESRLSKLIQELLRENRQEDIRLATSDEEARKEMYRKYGITD